MRMRIGWERDTILGYHYYHYYLDLALQALHDVVGVG
jgi:hypothetical protein